MSISNNTPKLQSLLEKINALPEAGSSFSTETWILTLEDGSTVTKEVHVE